MRFVLYLTVALLSAPASAEEGTSFFLEVCNYKTTTPKKAIDVGRCVGIFEAVLANASTLSICPPKKTGYTPDELYMEVLLYFMNTDFTRDPAYDNFPQYVVKALRHQWPCRK